ncbi:MAG TPA: TadE/TadG family type IV pilus assembly protein [Thermoleophilaceae bacterium]|jgi:pilus assembly protein CpaE
MRLGAEDGQATVELVAIVPAFVLACFIAWELVLAGHTAWLAAQSARAGARAVAVGRDARAAASSSLPRSLRSGLSVAELGGGRVRVRVAVPLLVSGWRGPVRVSATAGLSGGAGT